MQVYSDDSARHVGLNCHMNCVWNFLGENSEFILIDDIEAIIQCVCQFGRGRTALLSLQILSFSTALLLMLNTWCMKTSRLLKLVAL